MGGGAVRGQRGGGRVRPCKMAYPAICSLQPPCMLFWGVVFQRQFRSPTAAPAVCQTIKAVHVYLRLHKITQDPLGGTINAGIPHTITINRNLKKEARQAIKRGGALNSLLYILFWFLVSFPLRWPAAAQTCALNMHS